MAYGYYPNYFMNPFTNMQANPQQMQTAPQPTKNADFVLVRSEEEARNYPVAYGNTVTFKDENTPYMYTKTMGASQLDRPIFEKYKLVKETAQDAPETRENVKNDTVAIEKLQSEIGALWREINALKEKVVDNESV